MSLGNVVERRLSPRLSYVTVIHLDRTVLLKP
jgi:hypothetical protein